MRTRILAVAAVCLLAVSLWARAVDAPAVVKPYPFTICLVSHEALGDTPFVIVHEGQEVKFCCKGCSKKFTKEPQKYLDIIAAGKQPEAAAGSMHGGGSVKKEAGGQ